MTNQQLYPALKTLISNDSLPEIITVLMADVSDNLFYKNYQSEKSVKGDISFHSLTIVFDSELGFNLLGNGDDGLLFLINPGAAQGTTELPITFTYNWPIMRYSQSVTLQNLGSVTDYFNFILGIVNIPSDQVLYQTITIFLGGSNEPVTDFVNQFNADPDNSSYTPITIPSTDDILKLFRIFLHKLRQKMSISYRIS